MRKVFIYGGKSYDYHLQFEERKSLALTVYPSMSMVVKAPSGARFIDVEKFLIKKWIWLEKQLAEFTKYQKASYHRRYLAGESLVYLGRQYILRIVQGEREQVKIDGRGLLVLTTKSVNNSKNNQRLLEIWLNHRRDIIFNQLLARAISEFDYDTPPQLKVREMDKRWGSCTRNGAVITLNPRLIEAPMEAIRYVVVHELTHITHRNHNANFYRLMESHLPENWRNIKEELEIRLG
jgi:predicted metal-dependent hydrolase